jgi:hypothetical protein
MWSLQILCLIDHTIGELPRNKRGALKRKEKKPRHIYETQMPPCEANSKGGHYCQTTRSRGQTQGQIERSCHKEHAYEICITYHSQDMTNVKVFKK